MIRLVQKDGRYWLQERMVIGRKKTGPWWSPESEPIWSEWYDRPTFDLNESETAVDLDNFREYARYDSKGFITTNPDEVQSILLVRK